MTAPPQPLTAVVVEVVEAMRPRSPEAGADVVVGDTARGDGVVVVGGAVDDAEDDVGTVDPIGDCVVRAVTIAAAGGELVDLAAEWLPVGPAHAARIPAVATQANQVKRGIAL